MSESFRQSLLQYDKGTNIHYLIIDSQILSRFTKSSTIQRTSKNVSSISTKNDLLILQIMCLEDELIRKFQQNVNFQNYFEENKNLLEFKDKEIISLRKSISDLECQLNDSKVIFEKLYLNLKTFIHDKVLQPNSESDKVKVLELEKVILEENKKLKFQLFEIFKSKCKSLNELQTLIYKVQNDLYYDEHPPKNSISKGTTNNPNSTQYHDRIDSAALLSEGYTQDFKENHEPILSTMINELEKHLADEYKKIEEIHFKKDDNLKMSNSLQTRKTVSPVKRTNKNYVQYKEKKKIISSEWSNSLRNHLYSRGSIVHQEPSSKDNIRSSISKILNLRELEVYPGKVRKTSSMSLPCHNEIMSTKSYEQPNDSAPNIQTSPLPLEKQLKHLIFNFKKFH